MLSKEKIKKGGLSAMKGYSSLRFMMGTLEGKEGEKPFKVRSMECFEVRVIRFLIRSF